MDASSSQDGPGLDRATYLHSIEAEGRLLAAAAGRAGLDAAVPTCPEWTVRELVSHVGEVHRWATAMVVGGLVKPSDLVANHVEAPPTDDGLPAWFERGHRGLLAALRDAPDDLACFTFLADPPRPALFWARRQTHETGMHRVDAESALGQITPFSTTIAADGVDEMLTGFAPRKHTPLRSDHPRTLAIVLTDDASRWCVTISDGPVVTARGDGAADCTVSGSASDVYLALWNRQGVEPLTITGDPSVLAMYRDNVRVRWR